MTPEQERAVAEAAVAYVVWLNKVPSPPDYNKECDRLHDALQDAVQATIKNEEWWAKTYAPDGWPE